MNRVIKFRGKRVDNGEWAYGYYVVKQNQKSENGLPLTYWIVDVAPFGFKVDKETVGQFTGLLDKNGKEIYEGDLLENDSVFIEDKFIVEIFYDKEWSRFTTRNEFISNIKFKKISKVIGNIHDNKDLLNEVGV